MSPSAVLRRRPVRSPAREHPRPTPSDAPTAMRLVLTHRAEGPARPRRVPRHATSLAPDRQQGRDSSILHSFHIPPQTNRWFHLQEHVQRLQDHPMLESIALESFNLSSPPEYFFSIRGVLSAYLSPLICHSRVCGNPSLVRRVGSRLRGNDGGGGNDEKGRAILQLVIPAHVSPLICHSRTCGNPSSSFPVISGQRSCHSGLPCSIRLTFHWRFHFLICFSRWIASLMSPWSS